MSVSGFLGPFWTTVLIVVSLLSGALSVLREVQMMYLPPVADQKRVYWGFVRIAFVIAAVLLWMDEHSKVTQLIAAGQNKIQVNVPQQLPPQVQVNVPASSGNGPLPMAYISSTGLVVSVSSYRIGGNWEVTNTCKNSSPSVIADNVNCIGWLNDVETTPNSFGQPIVSTSDEEKQYRLFMAGIAPSRNASKRSFGPGDSTFTTLFSKTIDKKLDEEFRSQKRTIIFMSEYDWKDGSGQHSYESCEWLELPGYFFNTSGAFAPTTGITWHYCSHHNGKREIK